MSGLLQAFSSPPPVPVKLCKIGRLLTELTDEERAVVNAALASPRPAQGGAWSDEMIASIFGANGHPMSDSTVRDHRIGKCCCLKGQG